MPTILVVDDEPNIVELARLYFSREQFAVVSASDGEQALAQVEQAKPDVMLLDIMLPKLDGWEVCRRLRAAGNTLPIIVVTARDDDIDKIVGLEMGADDYVTKPFNPREVVARARALLRRKGWEQESHMGEPPLVTRLQAGNLTMDQASRTAIAGDRALTLRPREWELLWSLMQSMGQVRSRDSLLDDVWGYECDVDTRTIDVHIAVLREKLREAGASAVSIDTVWGIGYKLVEQQ